MKKPGFFSRKFSISYFRFLLNLLENYIEVIQNHQVRIDLNQPIIYIHAHEF